MRDAMPDACFARDSLSNLAASLNAGKDKAAGDAFFVYDYGEKIEAAAFRGKHGHGAAKAIATLLGAVAGFIQRWRPQEPDDPDPAPALHTGVDPSPHPPAPSSQSDPDLDHRYEPSPPGLIIKVTGNTPKLRDDSYAQGNPSRAMWEAG